MTEKQETPVRWLQEQMALTHSPDVVKWLFAKAIEMERMQSKQYTIHDMRKAFYKGVDAWMQNPDALESIFNSFIESLQSNDNSNNG